MDWDEDRPETEEDRVARLHHENYNEPAPWRRVYDGGRDITDQDPSTWPWPWRDDGQGHGRKARRSKLPKNMNPWAGT